MTVIIQEGRRFPLQSSSFQGFLFHPASSPFNYFFFFFLSLLSVSCDKDIRNVYSTSRDMGESCKYRQCGNGYGQCGCWREGVDVGGCRHSAHERGCRGHTNG